MTVDYGQQLVGASREQRMGTTIDGQAGGLFTSRGRPGGFDFLVCSVNNGDCALVFQVYEQIPVIILNCELWFCAQWNCRDNLPLLDVDDRG